MEWEKTPKSITLTNEQWSGLTIYILITTKFREREAEAWEKLAAEKNPDGTPRYQNAAGNAMFWREMTARLEEIRLKIDSGTTEVKMDDCHYAE